MIEFLVCKWLRWRYGGDVLSLRPPLGYHPVYDPRSAVWVAAYRVKYFWWTCEVWAFKRWGSPMRAMWELGKEFERAAGNLDKLAGLDEK